jgi:hypothetical protein
MRPEKRELSFSTLADFPTVWSEATLYIATDTNIIYRWNGTSYDITGWGWPVSAVDVSFDPSTSWLTKNNVQEELEELAWDIINTSTDVALAIPHKLYVADTNTQVVTIILPDISAATNDQEFWVVKSTNTNDLIVTTTSGTDLIWDAVTQAFVETDTWFKVKANNTTWKYEILQDSRSKTPTASVTFYAVTEPSGISTYNYHVTTTTDARFDINTPVDVPVWPITWAAQELAWFISDEWVIQGLIDETNITTIWLGRRSAWSWAATFYAEYYKREAGGTEILLWTSNTSSEITNASYQQFSVSWLISATTFLATDRFLVKFFWNRTGGWSDPTYDIQLEWTNPARSVLPIPTWSISHDTLAWVNQAWPWIVNWHISNVAQDIDWVKTFNNWILSDVNGVTLTNGWLATNFLQEDGNYWPAGWGWVTEAFKATLSPDQNLTTSIVKIAFNNETYDQWWNYSTVNNEYTVPSNWTYEFSYIAGLQGLIAWDLIQTFIYKDATQLSAVTVLASGANDIVTLTTSDTLVAGDLIQVRIRNLTAARWSVDSWVQNSMFSWFKLF